jgi:hypothetical protein
MGLFMIDMAAGGPRRVAAMRYHGKKIRWNVKIEGARTGGLFFQ